MKRLVVVFFILFGYSVNGQVLPADSIFLKKIYGSFDADGTGFTRKTEKPERIFSFSDSLKFRIILKEKIFFNNQNLILALVEAPFTNFKGIPFGYRHLYFFKQKDKNIQLVDSIVSVDREILGEQSSCQVIDIGNSKKAIVCNILTRKDHISKKQNFFFLLEPGKLTEILRIDAEYDDSEITREEFGDNECRIKHSTAKYDVIRTKNDWYEIKVHITEYKYSAGCKEKSIASESDKFYIWKEGKFVEK